MKAVLVILIALLIFFACAMIGYQLGVQTGAIGEAPPQVQPATVEGSEQHNLVIIQVDQLDAPQPRLVSVWFISLFFLDDASPRLAFVQLYSLQSTTAHAQDLARSFALDSSLEPSAGFWRSVRAFDIEWEAYFVVDNMSSQRIMEWVNGPGDYVSALQNPGQAQALLTQTCQALTGIASRQGPAFDWTGLAPAHFHSNMRMEIAMAYWDKVTKPEKPVICEVILSN